MTLLIGLLISGGGGSQLVSLMPNVFALQLVGSGIPFIVFDLHHYFVAIASAIVYEDGHGGSAPHPTVRDRGSNLKEDVYFKLSGSSHGYRVLLIFGGMAQSVGLLSMLMLLMLPCCLIQLGCW